MVLITCPRLTNMKSPRLPKGYSQLEIKATLRHRDEINDTMSVTFEAESKEKAIQRYLEWSAGLLNEHSNQTWDLLKKPAQ